MYSDEYEYSGHTYKCYLFRIGFVVSLFFGGDWTSLPSGNTFLFQISPKYIPIYAVGIGEATNGHGGDVIISISQSDGSVSAYNYGGAISSTINGSYYGSWISIS